MLPIPPRASDVIPILNATAFPTFYLSGQLRAGRSAQVVVTKATFELSEGNLRIAAEQDLPSGEVSFDDSCADSLRYPGDLALFKHKADVSLVGCAFPDGGRRTSTVRLRLGSHLDLRAAVFGDRKWTTTGPDTPRSFSNMPLRAERAFGGPGWAANPIGRGLHGSWLPNIEWVDALVQNRSHRPTPAITTPLPAAWSERLRFIGTYDRKWLERRWPDRPADFDWRFENTAPSYLQIPYPQGDETFDIHGCAPEGKVISGRLPAIRIRTFVQPSRAPQQLQEISMRIDTLCFDTEAARLTIVWRGARETADRLGSDIASLFVMSEAQRTTAPEPLFHECYRREYELDLSGPNLPAATLEPAETREALEAELLAKETSWAGRDLSRCDLSGLDLSGRDLSGAILVNADLQGATLKGSRLTGASLHGANARNAELSDAVLVDADLASAKLHGAHFLRADLRRACLDGVEATEADFRDASMSEVAATEANFQNARFERAELSSADFTQSNLRGARLCDVEASDLRLYEVDGRALEAQGSSMPNLRADMADLRGSSFHSADCTSASLANAELSDCDFRHATLDDAVLDDSRLVNAQLNQMRARRIRMSRSMARGARFVRADLFEMWAPEVCFEEADLRFSNLYRAHTFDGRFEGAILDHALLAGSGLEKRKP